MSLLKAQRLARGWTGSEAVAKFHELCKGLASPPKLNSDQLNAWENGRGRPCAATADLLCRLYATRPDRLGLAVDYGMDEPEADRTFSPSDDIADVSPLAVDSPLEGALLAAVRRVRNATDRTLAAGTVTDTQVDAWDEAVIRHRVEYLWMPPSQSLRSVLATLADVGAVAMDRQSATIQRRLSAVIAQLATMAADALMQNGEVSEARAWYSTARVAADDAQNPRLRALVRVFAAMLPYYYGDLDEVLRLTGEARGLVREIPCSAAALAAAAQARALARLGGDRNMTERVFDDAQRLFDRLDSAETTDVTFNFSERRWHLYQSGILTHLGDSKRAARVQQEALQLFPRAGMVADGLLIEFDRAQCLVNDGHIVDACQLATDVLASMSATHRPGIVLSRARVLVDSISPPRRNLAAVRRLRRALPPGPSP